jgi:hypothetical protein
MTDERTPQTMLEQLLDQAVGTAGREIGGEVTPGAGSRAARESAEVLRWVAGLNGEPTTNEFRSVAITRAGAELLTKFPNATDAAVQRHQEAFAEGWDASARSNNQEPTGYKIMFVREAWTDARAILRAAAEMNLSLRDWGIIDRADWHDLRTKNWPTPKDPE